MSEPTFDFDLDQMKAAVESGTISFPRGLTHNERRAYIRNALDRVVSNPCPKCGCVGLHSCMGAPIVWTEEDEARLKAALKLVVREENRASE